MIDGHLSYQEVLDLTPYQVAALLTEKSVGPGEMDPDVYRQFVDSKVKEVLGEE